MYFWFCALHHLQIILFVFKNSFTCLQIYNAVRFKSCKCNHSNVMFSGAVTLTVYGPLYEDLSWVKVYSLQSWWNCSWIIATFLLRHFWIQILLISKKLDPLVMNTRFILSLSLMKCSSPQEFHLSSIYLRNTLAPEIARPWKCLPRLARAIIAILEPYKGFPFKTPSPSVRLSSRV